MHIVKHTLIYFLIFSFLLISFFGNSIKPAKAASCTSAETKRMGDLIAKSATTTLTAAEKKEYDQLEAKCLKNVPTITPSKTEPEFTAPDPTAPHYAPGVLGTLDKNGKMPNGEYPSVANGGLIDPKATSDESCTKHCPGGTWWWKVDENIQNAICNMQCTIIDWESSMIGWVVSKVLYPALGLCVENDPSKPCPEPPSATDTKPI